MDSLLLTLCLNCRKEEILKNRLQYALKQDMKRPLKQFLTETNEDSSGCFKKTVENLGLSPFLVNQVVNRAFMSHLPHLRGPEHAGVNKFQF
jgi:hypothetical protein